MRDGLRAGLIGLMFVAGACTSSRVPEPVVAPRSAPVDLIARDYVRDLDEAARTLGAPPADSRPFALELPVPAHHAVEAAVSYFSGGRRETIQASFHRSGPWVPMIHQVLSSYGLPADLAYLPVIESGYRTTLTSTAGAHGMWQFMPATAREYGLRVDWWVDERADPWKATKAAAHYLSDLHRMFGDWPLALAAYNCGPGRVRRTLKEHGATTFWELLDLKALPKETRGYVPTFYATVVLAANPEKYDFDLPPASRVEFDEVNVRGPFSLAFVASRAGVDGDELRRLNAELHKGIVPPGEWKLRVPRGDGQRVASREWYLEDSTIRLASYSMRDGESLTTIAQRLDIPVAELQAINALRNGGARTGTVLWLPIDQRELSARLGRVPAAERWHVVGHGETLYSIARSNGLSVDELVDLNRLSAGQTIHPGDRLLVSQPSVATGGM